MAWGSQIICSESGDCADVVAIAAQLGRFDLVSLLLALIGIMLALSGILAFFNFRSIARQQAKEEASKVAKLIAEGAAIEHLQEELPKLISEYMELAKNAVKDQQANDIAQAQENGDSR